MTICPKTKTTFSVVALGCRTNQYEAEALKAQLETLGLRAAQGAEQADVCIVNSCTVTDGADASSRHVIREMRRRFPGAEIVVTGCMAEKEKENLFALDPDLHIVSNFEKEKLVAILFPECSLPEFAIRRFDCHTRAFVKVQDGCNSFCTYCVIPYVRGRSRSRPIEAIVREVEGLVVSGYKEIVLTGINVGDFSLPGGERGLSRLVRAVDSISGLERLRISSIDPNDVDDDLFDALMTSKHICPSSHLVLQSGSNVVLKRMNRKYTRQLFLEIVRRFLDARPEYTFTTDVIVGFPQETEGDFQETIEIVRSLQFAKVHIFPYSERPKTKAALYPNKVSAVEIKRRKALLHEVSEAASFALRQRFIGRQEIILTERSHDGEGTVGHTPQFLEVTLPGVFLPPNESVSVRLVGNSMSGLIGERVYS